MSKLPKINVGTNLEREQHIKLEALCARTGISKSEYLRRGIDLILNMSFRSLSEIREKYGIEVDETAKPIWEVIEEIMADVPDEEFEKLPKDGASEHDHYLYGTQKKRR